MEDWVIADSIDELKNIIFVPPPPKPAPPPIPKPPPLPPIIKYSNNKINIFALIVGFIHVILFIVIGLYRDGLFGTLNYNNTILLFIVFTLSRFGFAFWAYLIADRKKRSAGLWGILTFMIPGLCLIIISLLKNKEG